MDYETEYREMRAGAVKITGETLDRLVKKCQENLWLAINGIDFDDGLLYEGDYPYYLERYDDRELLKRFFLHGNWGVRTAVMHGDLIFVNQVNGGDEWWTLKVTDSDMISFESITMRLVIDRGEFDSMLDRMIAADAKACKSHSY